MGSPRIQQDELSGGLILAPGSQTTASVSEPLADIAGGKSGTEAEIENPYDSMPTAGTSGGPNSASKDEVGAVPAEKSASGQAGAHAVPDSAVTSQQGEAVNEKGDVQSDTEYSEQQQSQQASSGCKQS